MISTKYNCVFVHIPKVAGQSIEHFFLKLHGLSWDKRESLLLRYNDDPECGPERLAHLTASEYLEYQYLKREDFNNYFKFTFVRNPWERLVSEFLFRRKDKRQTLKEYFMALSVKKDRYSDLYRHILPQYDFIYDENNNMIVDFVGRFENLGNDFDHVCKELGIADSRLPHVNSTDKAGFAKRIGSKLFASDKKAAKQHYSAYYDDELKEHVAEFYNNDIRAFSYRFEEG